MLAKMLMNVNEQASERESENKNRITTSENRSIRQLLAERLPTPKINAAPLQRFAANPEPILGSPRAGSPFSTDLSGGPILF